MRQESSASCTVGSLSGGGSGSSGATGTVLQALRLKMIPATAAASFIHGLLFIL